METIDIFIVVVLGIGLVSGLAKGFIKQACGLVGLIAGLLVARALYAAVGEQLAPHIGTSVSVAQIISFIIIWAVIPALLMLAGADRSENHRIKLEYLQVTSGVGVRSVASLGVNISGEKFEAAATGNGPVDAAIRALKKIIDRQMVLKEFTIQAISKGSDDVGKVHMQVEYDGHVYYGFGANTDIVAASVEAYIDCINKFKH